MYVRFEEGQKFVNTKKPLEYSESMNTFNDCGYVIEQNEVVIDIDIDGKKNAGYTKENILLMLQIEEIDTQLVETTRGYHAYFTYDGLGQDEKFAPEGRITIGALDFDVEFKTKTNRWVTIKQNGVARPITGLGKRMTLPDSFLHGTIKKIVQPSEIVPFDGEFDFQLFTTCVKKLKDSGHLDEGGNYQSWNTFVGAIATMVLEGRMTDSQGHAICTLIDCGDESTHKKYALHKNEKINISYGHVVKVMKKNGINEIVKVSVDKAWLSQWERQMSVDQFGKPKPTRTNLVLIMEHDQKLVGKLAFNEFTKQIEVIGNVPWTRVAGTNKWEDSDEMQLRVYLDGMYGISPRDAVTDVVNTVSYERAFHPVKDYFNNLPLWDGVQRVETAFIDYLGVPDDAVGLIKAQTRLFFQAVVARTFEAGCKWDYVVLIKGDQGLGKSTFCQNITPSINWYSDSIESVEGKDAMSGLKGKLIIEFGELAALSKKEAETIKGFLTRRVDEYRPAYGRHEVIQPRQCVFVGTTNSDQPLKDESGGRRWWVMEAKKSYRAQEQELGKMNIDQLWAEAMLLYKEMKAIGGILALSPELEKIANEVQRDNTSMGVYEGEIVHALDNGLVEARRWDEELKTMLDCSVDLDRICAKQLWEIVLLRESKEMKDFDVKRINAIIQSHTKYIKKTRSVFGKYGKVQIYERR